MGGGEEPPDFFLCPLTLDVMDSPVILFTDAGRSFEKKALMKWLEAHPLRDPLTNRDARKPLKYAPNRSLKEAISEWRAGVKEGTTPKQELNHQGSSRLLEKEGRGSEVTAAPPARWHSQDGCEEHKEKDPVVEDNPPVVFGVGDGEAEILPTKDEAQQRHHHQQQLRDLRGSFARNESAADAEFFKEQPTSAWAAYLTKALLAKGADKETGEDIQTRESPASTLSSILPASSSQESTTNYDLQSMASVLVDGSEDAKTGTAQVLLCLAGDSDANARAVGAEVGLEKVGELFKSNRPDTRLVAARLFFILCRQPTHTLFSKHHWVGLNQEDQNTPQFIFDSLTQFMSDVDSSPELQRACALSLWEISRRRPRVAAALTEEKPMEPVVRLLKCRDSGVRDAGARLAAVVVAAGGDKPFRQAAGLKPLLEILPKKPSSGLSRKFACVCLHELVVRDPRLTSVFSKVVGLLDILTKILQSGHTEEKAGAALFLSTLCALSSDLAAATQPRVLSSLLSFGDDANTKPTQTQPNPKNDGAPSHVPAATKTRLARCLANVVSSAVFFTGEDEKKIKALDRLHVARPLGVLLRDRRGADAASKAASAAALHACLRVGVTPTADWYLCVSPLVAHLTATRDPNARFALHWLASKADAENLKKMATHLDLPPLTLTQRLLSKNPDQLLLVLVAHAVDRVAGVENAGMCPEPQSVLKKTHRQQQQQHRQTNPSCGASESQTNDLEPASSENTDDKKADKKADDAYITVSMDCCVPFTLGKKRFEVPLVKRRQVVDDTVLVEALVESRALTITAHETVVSLLDADAPPGAECPIRTVTAHAETARF